MLLDDLVSGDTIRAVWRRSLRSAVGTFVLFLIIWIFTGGLSGAFTSTQRDDSDALLIIGAVLAVIAFGLSWLLFLTSEKQEAISEWCTLLVGRAEAADSVYSHIAGRLRERRLPIHNYLVKRTPTGFGATGNRLVLVDGYHYVYVSVFSYGTSLYLGWSMWRVRKGSVLLHQYSSSRGTSLDPIGRILNLERLKAMREAVHAVCREALHTAVQSVSVSESYGFPSGMPPIEGLPYASAPQPGGAPGPAQPPAQP
ncbi:MAG TPA: hypothetical protein VGX25_25285 [Actinophytocola sp.]|uniref:hypothetical protein n=1 Tax=Actinophytocola sp. TaxID=1872138 RepID=UPI002DDD4384|nr:hypothetical protein [Actinophytocola sp.]HEV2782719.1 hypothetical protein [Actinophytocola sp.]